MKFYGSTAQYYKDLQSQSSARVKDDFLSSRNVENPYEDGSIYHQLFEENPYKDLYYDPTFWDNIGLSSKARDTNSQYQQLFNEYIANIAKMKAENEYNSPANQAALNKEAGLNPDLLGISDVGQMSGGNFQGSLPSSLDGKSPVIPVLTEMSSILSFALNAYNGISSTIMNLDNAEISNFSRLTDLASPFVTQSFAESFLNNQDLATASASGRDAFSRQFSRPKLRDKASKAFEHLFYSSRFDLARNALRNYSEFNDEEIKFGARNYFNTKDNGRAISDFIKSYVDLSIEEFNISKKSNISLKSKEKMLNDFRMRSIQRLTENYKYSNGADIMSGLLLAGMLESSSTSMLGDYKSYLMLSGDKISKDLGSYIDKGFTRFKKFWKSNHGF